MITKKIAIIALFLLSLSTIYSQEPKFREDLTLWEKNESYTNQTFNLGIIKEHTKRILEISFRRPQHIGSEILYLNLINHSGFSKIYLDNKLIKTVGSISNIKKSNLEFFRAIPLPIDFGPNEQENTLRIVNYSTFEGFSTEYNISTQTKPTLISRIYNEAKKIIPISFSIILLVLLIHFQLFKEKDYDNGSSEIYTISLVLFILNLLISGVSSDGLIAKQLQYLEHPIYAIAFGLFIIFYMKKHHISDTLKTSVGIFCTISLFISFFIVYQCTTVNKNIETAYYFLFIILHVVLILLTFKAAEDNERFFRLGVIFSAVIITIETLASMVSIFPLYGILQTGTMFFILSYDFSFLAAIATKVGRSENHSQMLLETIEKGKLELNKKEKLIDKLKSANGEILRDKSLLLSTLSSNLRAPLNSIIGYGENIYSTHNIDDVHDLVSEMILESDKMFQAINNVMDFSTKNFTNTDLQLKNFRMKEIFENSIYGSTILSKYRNEIRYKSIENSDKILISGNPNIYKEILTCFFLYLFEQGSEYIEYTISHSNIIGDYMDLDISFKAYNTKSHEQNLSPSNEKNKNTLTKYINLYDIGFNEEISDNHYFIDIKFQCGVSMSPNSDKKIQELPPDIVLERRITVLVVEDYIPNLKIVEMHLNKMGCNVLTAANGEEAVLLFKNNVVDIILMDIKMPIMDGWEATEKIRSTEKGLNTLIIGLTASSLELDIRHCFESGMDDVQVKPIRKNQLYNKLKLLDNLEPNVYPSPSQLRADHRLSKLETDTLFTSSILQIEKQLEVIELLSAAEDDQGVNKEMPAIIHAAESINAFYFMRLLRNFFDAYDNREKVRQDELLSTLKTIVEEIIKTNDIFRN